MKINHTALVFYFACACAGYGIAGTLQGAAIGFASGFGFGFLLALLPKW
jgi:hypothetical protein